MRVGVIIISYNNEYHIADAISSLKEQVYNDWTAIMIDNGSTDRTFEIVEQEILGDERFSAVKKTNEGPSAGRNLGFSLLPKEVEYIHFFGWG